MPAETTADDGVRLIVDATTPLEAANANAAVFGAASASQIGQLKAHEQPTIALRAAWESVLRTIPERRSVRSAPIDRLAIQRFLGFVEGRLQLPLPPWWNEALTSGRSFSRESFYFDHPDALNYSRSGGGVLARTEAGLLARHAVKVDRTDEGLLIASEEQSCLIPRDLVAEAKRRGGVEAVEILFDEDKAYVAFHSSRTNPHTLMCLERKTGALLWSSKVWAEGGFVSHTGLGYHFTNLRQKNEIIYIYGAGDHCVYVEAFSASDGENVLRFSSSY